LEREERLHDLAPEGCFIAPESIKHAVVDIGKAEETKGQFPRCVEWIFGECLELMAFGILRTIRVIVDAGRACGLQNAACDVPRRTLGLGDRLARMSAITQDFGLDLKKTGLDRCGAADTPQQGCQPKYQLAFDRGPGVVIRDDGCLERPVVSGILKDFDDGFGRQPVPESVPPGLPFAVPRRRTGTLESILPIGIDLPERGH